jgi:hypothetical protein
VAQDDNEQVVARSRAALSLLVAGGASIGRLPYELSLSDDRFGSAIRAGTERLQSEPDQELVTPSANSPGGAPAPTYVATAIPTLPTPSELVDRAKGGQLSKQELDALDQDLRRQENFDSVREQLLAMLYAGDENHRQAVERYLDFRADPEVARLALALLCSWGLTSEYVDRLISFMDGVDWDVAGDGRAAVRPLAFAIAGGYLRTRRSRRLLEHLVRVAGDTTRGDDDRHAAGTALLRAICVPDGKIAEHPVEDDEEMLAWAIQQGRERMETE